MWGTGHTQVRPIGWTALWWPSPGAATVASAEATAPAIASAASAASAAAMILRAGILRGTGRLLSTAGRSGHTTGLTFILGIGTGVPDGARRFGWDVLAV